MYRDNTNTEEIRMFTFAIFEDSSLRSS